MRVAKTNDSDIVIKVVSNYSIEDNIIAHLGEADEGHLKAIVLEILLLYKVIRFKVLYDLHRHFKGFFLRTI